VNAMLDLRDVVRREPMTLDGLGDVSQPEREAALRNWHRRMCSEHASARVFGALVEQMMQAGVASRHVRAVGAMVAQELDHGDRCARVVAALGGDPVAEMHDLPWVPRHDDVSPIEAVLRNVISIGCCSETVAVALVGTERELAATAALRATLARILADEVNHARFGWALVSEVAPDIDPATRWRLGRYLVSCFVHQIDFHAPFLEMGSASAEAMGIGAPDGDTNWAIFVETMERVTVPGLDAHGLAASAAWAEAKRVIDDRAITRMRITRPAAACPPP
jgi:hypothetical protein